MDMSRNTTSDVRSFSIYSFKNWGKLDPECTYRNDNVIWSTNGEETGRIGYVLSTVTGDSYLELDYKVRGWGEDWKPVKYKVPLEAVSCNFGGKRWFFRCPLYRGGQYCGRRVAVLYQVSDYFGCRYCADLTYESCNEGKRYRGYPWKLLSDERKAEELWEDMKRTHYNGKPTRKYRRYLKLLGEETDVYSAVNTMLEELL